MAYTLITPATEELITVAEAKKHMRVLHNNEDDMIGIYLMAAIGRFQEQTSRVISKSTWQLTLDKFPVNGIIEIMRCTVISVQSVRYIDSLGAEQEINVQDVKLDAASEPARLSPAFGKSWPTTANIINAVTIEFEAGYTDAAALNKLDKAAIFLMTAHWYRNREEVVVGKTANEVPKTADDIMSLRKIPNGF
ncbi:head-tail connector protein [Marinifilum flexuosum]|uniref:Putative phiE125 gp8 family phage protein n=1 Tax=Marinifilum flexuosum TaxID=1117708 RepID=A0A419WMS1_9BACT|nr:head-tail connector protein [Marinifilum flexuosum]RKD96780.1 putative phiE125 gp8 family phage protein [Marinifilum flexuosum]